MYLLSETSEYWSWMHSKGCVFSHFRNPESYKISHSLQNTGTDSKQTPTIARLGEWGYLKKPDNISEN